MYSYCVCKLSQKKTVIKKKITGGCLQGKEQERNRRYKTYVIVRQAMIKTRKTQARYPNEEISRIPGIKKIQR